MIRSGTNCHFGPPQFTCAVTLTAMIPPKHYLSRNPIILMKSLSMVPESTPAESTYIKFAPSLLRGQAISEDLSTNGRFWLKVTLHKTHEW
ncbi:hypothetical protein SCLCIDRAFT_495413 [Scleroderma citrinum Foug A]|uniref:Uncharacterized protein n=1 Tax=Scleroderma citrinum Foug A TaxID=1036808 RepID=A0A0C3AYB6_9AGAM|nr:hypothetical protein SCLCIDRAFT_495413 [Scleroderma citrinum Foug A]